MTLLGVGNDGGWMLCWRRARLLCWLVFCVSTHKLVGVDVAQRHPPAYA